MKISIRHTVVLLVAMASLVPLSIDTEQAGIFINYIYLVLLFLPFMKHRYSEAGAILVLIYTFIFIAGIFKMLDNTWYYALRVTFSYIVFILPFLLIFARIEDSYFEKFKQAIIIVSVLYSLSLLYSLISIGYNGDFYATKELVGTNRFGFIIGFGFFIALFEEKYRLVVKVPILVTLIVGMTLTFSRASIVAFLAAVVLMAIMNIRRVSFKYILGATLCGIVLLVVFRDTIIGEIADFFGKYLMNYKNYNLTSYNTSEGYRVYVLKQILAYVFAHPVFGSNYAGIYLLYPEYTAGGSSHNQYTDVLLRTGFVGFSLYLFVIYKMTLFYFRNYPGVFYGLMGILFYGFFHETFKLAHGSFLFAMLLSYYLLKSETAARLRAAALAGASQRVAQ